MKIRHKIAESVRNQESWLNYYSSPWKPEKKKLNKFPYLANASPTGFKFGEFCISLYSLRQKKSAEKCFSALGMRAFNL